jgi:nucleoside-diphosphate-sugar epimerase
VADLTLARAKLGFAPRVTLEEGLKRLLELDPRFSLR